MKIVKYILIFLFILISIPLIIAIFLPKDFDIEREIKINRPLTEVFDFIKYLKNQDKYSKWYDMDPGMNKTYQGTDGQVGFIAKWQSKNSDVGQGAQEIIYFQTNDIIKYKINFKEPFDSESYSNLQTLQVDSSNTIVKWNISGSMPYPFNFMQLFYNMDKAMGRDLEYGLNKLKKILENK